LAFHLASIEERRWLIWLLTSLKEGWTERAEFFWGELDGRLIGDSPLDLWVYLICDAFGLIEVHRFFGIRRELQSWLGGLLQIVGV
jgi:hypothetical protein